MAIKTILEVGRKPIKEHGFFGKHIGVKFETTALCDCANEYTIKESVKDRNMTAVRKFSCYECNDETYLTYQVKTQDEMKTGEAGELVIRPVCYATVNGEADVRKNGSTEFEKRMLSVMHKGV